MLFTKHTVQVEAAVETEFDCAHCGYTGMVTVEECGRGTGTSVLGLDRDLARAHAAEQAAEDLAHQSKVTATLLACPQCQRRSTAGVAMFVAGSALLATLLGTAAVLGWRWLHSWELALALGGGALVLAIARLRRYRRSAHPLGVRLRPRVPEARVVRAPSPPPSPATAARPADDPPATDTPRFLS